MLGEWTGLSKRAEDFLKTPMGKEITDYVLGLATQFQEECVASLEHGYKKAHKMVMEQRDKVSRLTEENKRLKLENQRLREIAARAR